MPRVLCNITQCIHWIRLKESESCPRDGRPNDWEEKYSGVCDRETIAIRRRIIKTLQTRYELPECWALSRKGHKYHIDLSRFPQGGAL